MSLKDPATLSLLLGFCTSVAGLCTLGALGVLAIPAMQTPGVRWLLRMFLLLGMGAGVAAMRMEPAMVQAGADASKYLVAPSVVKNFFHLFFLLPLAFGLVLALDLVGDYLVKGFLGRLIFLVAAGLGCFFVVMKQGELNDQIFVYRLGVAAPAPHPATYSPEMGAEDAKRKNIPGYSAGE